MKAVVVELKGRKAVIMRSDGELRIIKDQGYDIGCEFDTDELPQTAVYHTARIYRFAPVLAAAAAFIVLVSGGIYTYATPFGLVSLDVNPSIEYTINRYDRVLSVEAVNDEGEDIVSAIDTKGLVNSRIGDAIDTTVEEIRKAGYFSEEDDSYLIVAAGTKNDRHTEKLVNRLSTDLSGHEGTKPSVEKVTDDEIEEAHRQGISPGKKLMIDRLDRICGGDLDRSEWNNKSVRDIMHEYERFSAGESDTVDDPSNRWQEDNIIKETEPNSDKPEKETAPAQDPEGQTKPEVPAQDPEGQTKPEAPAQDPGWQTKPETPAQDPGQGAAGEPPSGGETQSPRDGEMREQPGR